MRTVLPPGRLTSAIRVVNVSDKDYLLKKGEFLTDAEEAVSSRSLSGGIAVSSAQTNVDGGVENNSTVPITDRNVPTTDRNVTATDRNVFATDHNVSATDRNVSATDRNVPATDRNVPANDRRIRASQEHRNDLADQENNRISDQNHIQAVIEGLPAQMSAEQRKVAEEFIRQNADVFSRSEFDLGRSEIIKHNINTEGHRSFKQQLRRHPVAHHQIIDDHVDKMVAHGIVEPTASPWASNVVLVKKNDGELRFCVDFRQLNSCTVKDSYPLPRIDTCMDALGGARYFSTLDLRSGYWQVGLDAE